MPNSGNESAGTSTDISVKIELQVDDVKRLENHEAVAFGDVEITMAAAAARYLYTGGGRCE